MGLAARYHAPPVDPIPRSATQAREWIRIAQIEKARLDSELAKVRRDVLMDWRNKRDAVSSLQIAAMRQSNLIERYRLELERFEQEPSA